MIVVNKFNILISFYLFAIFMLVLSYYNEIDKNTENGTSICISYPIFLIVIN